eukprot:TRINITY_DN2876_c0_g1_i12.p1 TRINITY_DN2876_c0_g1~~TRINITY_DN2876_c0_g1_i12.p1  ORF type:complete len:230 (+),score=33.50 TRINITY_DN2876_c0_g1_i12:120-809(+)
MIRRPPRSTLSSSSAASDVYKRQYQRRVRGSASPSKGGNQRPATVSIMGRAAIGTSFREDKTARKVTLSKRKKGLYKKSQELAQLCGVEIAIICVGQFSKPSAFVASPSGEKDDIASVSRVCQVYSEAMAGKAPGIALGEPSPMLNELQTLRSMCGSLQGELNSLRAEETKPQTALTEEIARLRVLCGSLQSEVSALRNSSSQPETEEAEFEMAADRLAMLTTARPRLE